MSEQNQNANNIPDLPPASIVVIDGTPSPPGAVLPPSFTSGGGNGGLEAVARLQEAPLLFPFGAKHITVDKNEDILEKLIGIAREREVFILGAHGTLSYVELCNRQDSPLANTALQGNFSINSLEGNMVIPRENEPNRASRVVVQVIGEDGKIRGGPVRKLISKSRVQVIISSMSRGGIENWARNAFIERTNNDVPQLPINDKRKEYANEIYENTLREINERNTFAWRCSQLKE